MGWQALSCLPTSAPRVHELRRRLAAVFFFDDVTCGRRRPAEILSVHVILDRLDGAKFSLNSETDYPDLAAMFRFLDVVVNDGGAYSVTSGAEEVQFNEGIDELVKRLKSLFRKIDASGAGHVSRLASKTILEGLQHRLLYSVRTKRVPKKSIFDRVAPSKPDASLPKQQEYMRNFFNKLKADA